VVAHVDGGHAAEGGLDPVAVAVIDEGGAGCAAHARQAVLGVVGQVVGVAAHLARGLVAVGVVPVLLVRGRRPAQVRDGVFVGRVLVVVGRALKVGDVADGVVAVALLAVRAATASTNNGRL
jgi:hypothetical protein